MKNFFLNYAQFVVLAFPSSIFAIWQVLKSFQNPQLRYLELDGRLGFNESTLQDQAALLRKKGINALLVPKPDPKDHSTLYVRERIQTGSSYDDWARAADKESSARVGAKKGWSHPIANSSPLKQEPSPDRWWKHVDLEASDSDFQSVALTFVGKVWKSMSLPPRVTGLCRQENLYKTT